MRFFQRDIFRAVALTFCVTLSVTLVSEASASPYWFSWTPDPEAEAVLPVNATVSQCEVTIPGIGSHRAGRLNYFQAGFDPFTNLLTVTASFSPCDGVLPNGYWGVINDGGYFDNTLSSREVAAIYFDGIDTNNPKVTIYGYNGDISSYRRSRIYQGLVSELDNLPADRIFTSIGQPNSLKELTVTDDGATGARIFHLSIDATEIRNHIPLFSNPNPAFNDWLGTGFSDRISFLLHPVVFPGIEYCTEQDVAPQTAPLGSYGENESVCEKVVSGQSSVGFIKRIVGDVNQSLVNDASVALWENPIIGPSLVEASLVQGSYERFHVATNQAPLCNIDSVSATVSTDLVDGQCYQAFLGEAVSAKVTGFSANNFLSLDHVGLPSGAAVSGDVTPTAAHYTSEFNWTPSTNDVGKEVTIDFVFANLVPSLLPATIPAQFSTGTCSLRFCVVENLALAPIAPGACPIEPDRCGVCGGNGTSCLDCQSSDITQTLVSLDGGALGQRQLVVTSTRRLNRLGTRKAANNRYIRATRELATELFEANSTATWSIPEISSTCANPDFCVEVSNLDAVSTYLANSEQLFNLVKQTRKRLRRQLEKSGMSRSAVKGVLNRIRRRARNLHNFNVEMLEQVPLEVSDCG